MFQTWATHVKESLGELATLGVEEKESNKEMKKIRTKWWNRMFLWECPSRQERVKTLYEEVFITENKKKERLLRYKSYCCSMIKINICHGGWESSLTSKSSLPRKWGFMFERAGNVMWGMDSKAGSLVLELNEKEQKERKQEFRQSWNTGRWPSSVIVPHELVSPGYSADDEAFLPPNSHREGREPFRWRRKIQWWWTFALQTHHEELWQWRCVRRSFCEFR